MKKLMTREQAIQTVGENFVRKVESENCEPTGRCGFNGKCQGDDSIEWSAQVRIDDESSLVIYYYTDSADESEESWTDFVNWENCIGGYEIK